MSTSNLSIAALLSVAAATFLSDWPVAVTPVACFKTISFLQGCAHAGTVTSASTPTTTAVTHCFCILVTLPVSNVELHNRPTGRNLLQCVEQTRCQTSSLHRALRLRSQPREKSAAST